MNTVTFFPRDIPILKVSLEDFLRQADTDTITILIAPLSTTTPNLEAGDPTRNPLQNIVETLDRAEILPTPPTPSPRVEATSKVPMTAPTATPIDNATLLRVQVYSTLDKPATSPTHTPTSIINYKYKWKRGMQRITQTRYNLRDRGTHFKSQAARQLLVQHTFKAPKAMHIYDKNGKRHSMDNLLQGLTKNIWNKALRNEWGRLSQWNDRGVVSTDKI